MQHIICYAFAADCSEEFKIGSCACREIYEQGKKNTRNAVLREIMFFRSIMMSVFCFSRIAILTALVERIRSLVPASKKCLHDDSPEIMRLLRRAGICSLILDHVTCATAGTLMTGPTVIV